MTTESGTHRGTVRGTARGPELNKRNLRERLQVSASETGGTITRRHIKSSVFKARRSFPAHQRLLMVCALGHSKARLSHLTQPRLGGEDMCWRDGERRGTRNVQEAGRIPERGTGLLQNDFLCGFLTGASLGGSFRTRPDPGEATLVACPHTEGPIRCPHLPEPTLALRAARCFPSAQSSSEGIERAALTRAQGPRRTLRGHTLRRTGT